MAALLGQDEWDEIMRRIKTAIDDYPNKVRQIIDNLVQKLPPDVLATVQGVINDTWNEVTRIVKVLVELWEKPGYPLQLWDFGTTWTNEVGGPASSWQDALHFANLRTNSEWSGSAADTYRNRTIAQSRALGSTKLATDQIDDVLSRLATSIVTLWTAVVAATVMLSAALVGMFAAVASVGLVAALADVVRRTATVITTAVGAFQVFILNELLPHLRDLNQRLHNNEGFPNDEGFPNGNWPRLTSDISDSSHRHNKGHNAAWDMSKA